MRPPSIKRLVVLALVFIPLLSIRPGIAQVVPEETKDPAAPTLAGELASFPVHTHAEMETNTITRGKSQAKFWVPDMTPAAVVNMYKYHAESNGWTPYTHDPAKNYYQAKKGGKTFTATAKVDGTRSKVELSIE